jgi:DNA-binding IclR family transcriptional regulator
MTPKQTASHPAPAPDGGAESLTAQIPLSTPEGRHDRLAELGVTGKAFMVLEIVAESAKPTSIPEIIRRTGLTKPTAHRVVNMLVDMGFLERDLSDTGFIEGPALVGLAHRTLVASAPRSMRSAILQDVASEVGETCNYGVLSGAEVIYLDRIEAKWPLGLRFEAGSRVPAHCTAIGKLMLSKLPEEDLERLLRVMPCAPYTPATITDPAALKKALETIRQDDIGTDNQEFMHGVNCVAVPITDAMGHCLGGLAVSAPEARMTLNQLLGIVPMMRRAAERFAATYATPAGTKGA